MAEWELSHNNGDAGNTCTVSVPYADLEYLVLEKFRQEMIEEIEGINLKTPRGRWLMFHFLATMNDIPKTPRLRRETGTGGGI